MDEQSTDLMTPSQRLWFDTPVERRNTDSVKWDLASEGEIPLWVADMDFKAAPCIQKALETKLGQGVFGYTLIGDRFKDAIRGWFSHRHGWEIAREAIIPVDGLVAGSSIVIKALTEPGDGVLIMNPAYNCFFSSIRNVGCKTLTTQLLYDSEGRAMIDWEDFEKKAADAKVLLMCNPHNPTGRLWSREELARTAEIARRYGLAIVSDEIHNEITRPGTLYTPMATVMPDVISMVSPTKSWNIAGLAISALICPREDWRAAIDRVINVWEHCDLNQFGPAALEAAYSPEGEEWVDCMREYVWENYELLRSCFGANLPDCTVSPLEATYLAWVRLPEGMDDEELCKILRERCKVWINPGTMYGQAGYVRINIACPRTTLEEGLKRIIGGLRDLRPAGA